MQFELNDTIYYTRLNIPHLNHNSLEAYAKAAQAWNLCGSHCVRAINQFSRIDAIFLKVCSVEEWRQKRKEYCRVDSVLVRSTKGLPIVVGFVCFAHVTTDNEK